MISRWAPRGAGAASNPPARIVPHTRAARPPQEMFDEYFRGLQRPNTPQKTFRIRVFLFDAEFDYSPEAMGFTDEEVQACEQAIQR